MLAYCWAHATRKLVEITRNGRAPIAEDGVPRIDELYRIEAGIRGFDPATRLAVKQERSASIIGDFEVWLTLHGARVARKSTLGEALTYIAKYWHCLCMFSTDGRIELDTDDVEKPLSRPVLRRFWLRRLVLPGFDHLGVSGFCIEDEFHLSVPDLLDPTHP